MDKSEPLDRLRALIVGGWKVESTDCSTVRNQGFKFLWRLARGEDRFHLYF